MYDHYENKLEKLIEKKKNMISNGKIITNTKFNKVFLRNEEKYNKSKVDYIRNSINTNDKIEELNDKRFFLTNSVLLEV